MLPIEFITAIPPAAAAGPSQAVGRFQKVGNDAEMPKPARQKHAIARTGLSASVSPAPSSPADASRQGRATCQTRSPVRSELRENTIIPTTPARLGSADR